MALLCTEDKFSCAKSAEILENVSHDKLSRFLSTLNLNPEINIKSLPKGGKIVVEDTSLSKMYAKYIE